MFDLNSKLSNVGLVLSSNLILKLFLLASKTCKVWFLFWYELFKTILNSPFSLVETSFTSCGLPVIEKAIVLFEIFVGSETFEIEPEITSPRKSGIFIPFCFKSISFGLMLL